MRNANTNMMVLPNTGNSRAATGSISPSANSTFAASTDDEAPATKKSAT
jgi:hypothetical protein